MCWDTGEQKVGVGEWVMCETPLTVMTTRAAAVLTSLHLGGQPVFLSTLISFPWVPHASQDQIQPGLDRENLASLQVFDSST